MQNPIASWLFFGPKNPRNRFAAAVATGVLFLFLALAIATLARQALQQIRELNTASSDNLQWTLSQTEVEYLQLFNAMMQADADPGADLAPLRRWYDIFVSRMRIIMTGPVYGHLAEQPKMVEEFGRINAFLDNSVTFIDGPDAQLRTQLPTLLARAAGLRQDVRSISLEGIRVFSTMADKQRLSVSETMARIALLTVALILLLLLALFFLARIYGVTRSQAFENKATRDRLQAMLNTSLDAVLVVDRQGRFVEFNGAATEIFGYSEDEALGAEMTKLIFPDHLIEAHTKGMQRHLDTGEERVIGKGRVQMQARRRSGEVFPMEFSVARTMSPEGEIFVGYLRDISERIRAEERLTRARDDALAGERAKARFMAVMSHEMRTPLNGLLGSLDLLKGTRLSPKQLEFAEVMLKSGEMLLHHVNDVLDIARLESGRIVGDTVALDLDTLVQEVLESQAALAQAKGLSLRYRPEIGPIGTIMSSAIGLRQVLLNLISNAIKFTEHGLVEVQASISEPGEGADQRLSLRVRDTGIGIAVADQSRVFDDFVTLDSSFGRRADGTGLGLGIARRIVQSMGGEIGVVSQPKLGATFWIDLPYHRTALPPTQTTALPEMTRLASPTKPSPAKPSSKRRPVPNGLHSLDILVVEDNQINRFILREMLAADGHRVVEAVDGLEGVNLAQKHRFDLIFMDISMPALDGIAATVRLRAGNGPCCEAPIVALTAHALPDDRALFLASGMNAVLNKPLDRAMLMHVLAELTLKPLGAATTVGAQPRGRGARGAIGAKTGAAKPIAPHQPILPILRESTLDDLISALGRPRLSGLIERFITEGDAAMTRSAETLQAQQLADAQAVLHSLAGAAATFGALALQAHLAQMETDLKAQNGALALAAHPDLVALWGQTKADISRQVAP